MGAQRDRRTTAGGGATATLEREDRNAGGATLSAARERSSDRGVSLALFSVPVIQCLDLDHPSILKPDLLHQLVRAEVVKPYLDGYFHLATTRLYPLAVDKG